MDPDVEYSIGRDLPAPRETVFRAWTDPEHLAAWFGPYGFTTPPDRMSIDLQPGGRWDVVMVSADGAEAPLGGTYREVVEPARLVFTTGDPDNTEGAIGSVVTLNLADREGQTEMTFHQAGYHAPPENADAARAGWDQFFDRLDDHLRALQS
jgi:uncharacterized protein YndB with AHSA1/START domain